MARVSVHCTRAIVSVIGGPTSRSGRVRKFLERTPPSGPSIGDEIWCNALSAEHRALFVKRKYSAIVLGDNRSYHGGRARSGCGVDGGTRINSADLHEVHRILSGSAALG